MKLIFFVNTQKNGLFITKEIDWASPTALSSVYSQNNPVSRHISIMHTEQPQQCQLLLLPLKSQGQISSAGLLIYMLILLAALSPFVFIPLFNGFHIKLKTPLKFWIMT